MEGQVSADNEMQVEASKVWEVYRSVQLVKLIEKHLPAVDKIEVIQGDGGLDSVFHIVFALRAAGISSYQEKITKVDEENRIKEAEALEGGYHDLGFSLYRVRFQVLDKEGSGNCIVRSTVEYALKLDADPQTSQVVSTKAFEAAAKIVESYLLQQPINSDLQSLQCAPSLFHTFPPP